MSYFKHYFNLRREKTLRRYSRPVNLKRFDRLGWMTDEAYVWAVPEHLWKIAHSPLVPTAPAEIDRQTWTSVYSWPSYWGGWDRKSAGSADFGWIIGDYGLLARHDARERQDKSLGVIW